MAELLLTKAIAPTAVMAMESAEMEGNGRPEVAGAEWMGEEAGEQRIS